jgi:hypothetical protein
MRIKISMLLALALGLSAPALATWTDPVPVTEINTTYHDKAPFLSFDGRTLYFSRQDGPGWDYTRIYQATRQDSTGPFTAVDELSALVYSGGHVDYPWVSPDNLRMYYYTQDSRDWKFRLIFTERASTSDLWLPGLEVIELNALGDVFNPSLTPDELTIFFGGDRLAGGLGGYDLWMATRPDTHSPFGNVTNLTELNSTAWDFHPAISPDALTIYFGSRRNGISQLFTATRESVAEPFGSPERLRFFDLPGNALEYPSPSSDGNALYFTRSINGGQFDIYVSYIPEPGTFLLLGLGAVMLFQPANVGQRPRLLSRHTQ